MANIINIFHKDVLPTDLMAEYEMTDLGLQKSEVLLYRRGLSPRLTPVTQGMNVNIPLLPIEGVFSSAVYRNSLKLKREVKKFIIDSIPYLRTQEMKIKEAAKLARDIFLDQGTFLRHCLYSSDLKNRIGPVYDVLSDSKCIDIGQHPKNTLIFLPEEVFTGILSIKDIAIDTLSSVSGYTNSRAKFGIMLFKDNVLMYRVI